MDSLKEFISRRRFFNLLASLGGLATLIVVTYPLLSFLRPPKRSSEKTSYVEVGSVTDILPEKGKNVIAADGEPVIIANRGSPNGFVALSLRCTHLGCIVQLVGNELFCPCHGARFNLDGQVISGPAPLPLPKYELKILGDKIYLGSVIKGS